MEKVNTKVKWLFISMIALISMQACSEDSDYYPKPRGDLRLSFPDRVYDIYESDCPFSFEIPEYFSPVALDSSCNRNIDMGQFNATLFLTYLPVDSNLFMNIEYSRKLAYEHSVKADEIREVAYVNPSAQTYGLSYDIVGNAASPYQFYLTDSADHFMRGALYFNTSPNYDSVKPSLDYIKEDIRHMIETTSWK